MNIGTEVFDRLAFESKNCRKDGFLSLGLRRFGAGRNRIRDGAVVGLDGSRLLEPSVWRASSCCFGVDRDCLSRNVQMSFQAYLDNIQAKTGKTPDDFRRMAHKRVSLRKAKFAMALRRGKS